MIFVGVGLVLLFAAMARLVTWVIVIMLYVAGAMVMASVFIALWVTRGALTLYRRNHA